MRRLGASTAVWRPCTACLSASRCVRMLSASSASCCRGLAASASASASCVLEPEPRRRSSGRPGFSNVPCWALSSEGLAGDSGAAAGWVLRSSAAAAAVSSSARSGLAVAGVHSPARKRATIPQAAVNSQLRGGSCDESNVAAGGPEKHRPWLASCVIVTCELIAGDHTGGWHCHDQTGAGTR
jgi:hypothetical protein